jgi:urease accessory protein UreE
VIQSKHTDFDPKKKETRNTIVAIVEQGFESRDLARDFFRFAVSVKQIIKPNSKQERRLALALPKCNYEKHNDDILTEKDELFVNRALLPFCKEIIPFSQTLIHQIFFSKDQTNQ